MNQPPDLMDKKTKPAAKPNGPNKTKAVNATPKNKQPKKAPKKSSGFKVPDSQLARESTVLSEFRTASGGTNGMREVVQRITYFKDIKGAGYTSFCLDPTTAYSDTTSHVEMSVPHRVEVDVLEPVVTINGDLNTTPSSNSNWTILACTPCISNGTELTTNNVNSFGASYTQITPSQMPKWRRVLAVDYKAMVKQGFQFVYYGLSTTQLRQLFRIAIVDPDDGGFAPATIELQIRVRYTEATIIRPTSTLLMGIVGDLSTVTASPSLAAGVPHSVFIEPLKIQNQS